MGASTGYDHYPSGHWEEVEELRHGTDHSLRAEVIQEDSEPVSPSSLLTEMLRNPPSNDQENPARSPSRHDSERGEHGAIGQRVERPWEDLSSTVSERTSLLPKTHDRKLRHLPRSGAQDLEYQRISPKPGGSGTQYMGLWPNNTPLDFVRSIMSPKRWTIRRNDIIRPVTYVPAVILGLLLNILDALSYG